MQRRYEVLEAMRGLAAVAVLLYHARYFFPGLLLARSGYLAVDFFFVLSGFVIAHAYEDRLAGDLSAGRFLERRLIRLWPLYFAGLTLGAAMAALDRLWDVRTLGPADIGVSYLLGLGFLPTLRPGETAILYPLNLALWSLTFEVAANIAYAVAFRRLTDAAVRWILAICLLGLVAAAVAKGTLDLGWRPSEFGFGFLRVGFSFFAGVLLWRRRDRIPQALKRIGPWPLLGLLTALLFAPAGPVKAAFALAFILVLSPLIVAAGAAANQAPNALFTFLGRTSYALYVLHWPLVSPALALAARLGVALPLAGALFCAACLAAAWLADALDRRVRAWLTAFAEGLRPAVVRT